MNVIDLKLGSPDSLGIDNVSDFYARKPPEYAVYRTENTEGLAQRVLVHFADETSKADDQRKTLAQLAPIRGEIAGLIDSWRAAPDRSTIFKLPNGAKLRKRAEHYDRRVGDALTVAMEGDLTGAGEVLRKVKEDITEERIGWSRFEYLLTALGIAGAFVFVGALASRVTGVAVCDVRTSALCFEDATHLWRGAMAGACGSFFSIVLAIRGRTILTDLNRTSNNMDAALRVTIGIIAGMVLVALIAAGFVKIAIGESSTDPLTPLYVAIAGFLAGFTERLVPDLLAKAEARTGESPVLRRSESEPDTKAKAGAASSERGAGAASQAATAPAPDPEPEQAHEDGCVAEVALQPEEITPDESLPAASGGVAIAQPPVAA